MEQYVDPTPDPDEGWSHASLTPQRIVAIRALVDRRLEAIRAGDVDAL